MTQVAVDQDVTVHLYWQPERRDGPLGRVGPGPCVHYRRDDRRNVGTSEYKNVKETCC
jgi:hypothetical protein